MIDSFNLIKKDHHRIQNSISCLKKKMFRRLNTVDAFHNLNILLANSSVCVEVENSDLWNSFMLREGASVLSMFLISDRQQRNVYHRNVK